MIYSDFNGTKLSKLGFGTMRFPLIEGTQNIDEAAASKMIDYAMENGINYFDTAYPYHLGRSEIFIGKALKKFPRDSYYLATKYPGHQIAKSYDPERTFEEQLEKCGVDYFDFYLYHNVCENSIDTYLDPKWGIVDYFIEQKKCGRIKHLGFSTHGMVHTMERFLDYVGNEIEFCQIQLNYLDWTLQNAKAKCELLSARGLPIWVMEPIRGGKLATLSKEAEAQLKALRPDESIPAWSFRWLQEIKNITVILSGMSNMDQLKDNIETFTERKPLTCVEKELLNEIADGLTNSIPCTSCRYCTEVCPQDLDIPLFMSAYNNICYQPSPTAGMVLEALPSDKQPSVCLGCGACKDMCPQNIDIPEILSDLSRRFDKMPKWADLCREREKAALRMRETR